MILIFLSGIIVRLAFAVSKASPSLKVLFPNTFARFLSLAIIHILMNQGDATIYCSFDLSKNIFYTPHLFWYIFLKLDNVARHWNFVVLNVLLRSS